MIVAPANRPATSAAATGGAPGAAPDGALTVMALVAHARAVPSVAREAFADTLAALPDDPRRIVVHTCHRVELYVAVESDRPTSLPDPPVGTVRLDDDAAVRHLLEVAAGLDSAVLGETQVLHQLRETVEGRHDDRGLDPILHRLFQVAFRTGREARAMLPGRPRSLADVALDRIERAQPSIDGVAGLRVVVVGTGQMGRLTALTAKRRGATVLVTGRTPDHVAALARDVGGSALAFDDDGSLPPVAGAIVAIHGTWPLGADDLATLRGAATTVVDLSSPPALREDIRAALDGAYVSVDDLAGPDGDGPRARLRTKLERIVSRGGAEFSQWLRARGSGPAIRVVVEAAEKQRATEMAWLRRRLPALSEEDLAVVDQMSHRLVASMLHRPLTALTADREGHLDAAARRLFGA